MPFEPGDDIRVSAREIGEGLEDVGLAPSDPWVWVTYRHARQPGAGIREGLFIAAGHIVGQERPRLLDFTAPHPWEGRLDGFRFELLGRRLSNLPTEPRPIWAMADLPQDLDILDGFGLIRVEVWRWRAIHDDAPVFAQVDWRPGWAHEVYSHGGVRVGEANDNARANLGLAILQHQTHTGRPPGDYDYPNRTAYEQAIWTNIYDKPDRLRKLEAARSDTIALWLNTSLTSMKRYRRRFGIGIKDIRWRRVARPK